MRLKEAEYNKCWISPYSKGFLSTIQKELSSFSEFDDTRLGKKRVYTWIVLMYDPHSPWWMEESQYYNRKRETAIEAGFEMEGVKFPSNVEDVLTGQNEQINKMVAAFISRFANPEFTQLINLLELQNHVTQDMIKGTYDSQTTRVLNAITEDVNRITNRLFGSGEQDEVLAAKKALYQEAEESRRKLNPENIVKILNEEGALPNDFNPYDGYTPEETRFISDEGEEKANRL